MAENLKSTVGLLILFVLLGLSVNAQLKADFSADITSGCTPLLVRFNDLSTGNPTTWKWDLGEGSPPAYAKSVSKVYTTPGVYTVSLVVTNASGKDSVAKQGYIRIFAKPVIDFSALPANGCAPLPVQFTDLSNAGSGTITERVWDFGDGQIDTVANPIHTYSVSNVFKVTLSMENSDGCRASLTRDSVVNIYDGVNTQFSYSYINACQPPTKVSFKNLSTSQKPITYNWDFGDGNTSTEANPVYTYTNPGNFTVKLTATTSSGCTNSFTEMISIGTVKPDFALPTDECVNRLLTFTNTSTPLPVSVLWDFGDGGTANTPNSTHAFKNAGTYNVKMVADFGNCKSEIVHPVTILNRATPDFQLATPLIGCSLPATVQFKNTSSGAQSYQWLFGDGSTSTDPNPVHTFTKAGSYNVTLIAYNTKDCSDTIKKLNFIRLGPPKITGFNNLPEQGCAPITIKPTANIQTPEPIASYFWNFGDGTTSASATPTHTYANPGSYSVSLTVTTNSGCKDSIKMNNAVLAGVLPKPKFSATPLSGCANTNFQFTDESGGLITAWNWDFGDRSTSQLKNPDHIFRDTGYFNITLHVQSNGCEDSITLYRYIQTFPPKAFFSAEPQCNSKLTVDFADSSTGAKSWLWDFGDGQTSTAKDVSHTYRSDGTYIVKLTVTNGDCTDSYQDTVRVSNITPKLILTSPESNLCRKYQVSFKVTGQDISNVSYYQWDFGDNTPVRTGQFDSSVFYYYATTGTFFPSVKIIYKSGCIDSLGLGVQGIRINGPRAFFSNPAGVCLSQNISFNSFSTTDGVNAITKYIWNFGDGGIDSITGGQATHLYTSPGTYTVQLQVIDQYGCKDSIIKTDGVIIAKPIADFTLADSISCTISPLPFTNTSQGIDLQALWNFGDGTSSTQFEPQHLYPVLGHYTVQLNVTDKFGCKDSITKIKTVTIADPKAALILNDTFGVCPPLLIKPINNSENYTSVLWDFGDGSFSDVFDPQHYYNMAGNYSGSLIVKGHGICYDTVPFDIVLKGPSGTFNYTPLEGCKPQTMSFIAASKNTVNHIWDFNNGVTAETKGETINYTYENYGKYLPKLILVDAAGCQVPIINTEDTVVVGGVVAGMKITQSTGCDSSLLVLADSSTLYYDTISTYRWDFGNNYTAFESNPSYYYHNSGTYNVSLEVTTNKGCTSTVSVPLQIVVNQSPQLTINAPDSSCIFSAVSFNSQNNVTDNSLKWQWDFGDGNINSNQNAVNTYQKDGLFNVILAATNQFGCSDTVFHPIQIIPSPLVDAGLDTVLCLGTSVNLQASGAVNYNWLPDPSLSCTNCPDPRATPAVSTTFYLTGKDAFGCQAKDSVFVDVKGPITLSVSRLDSLCAGQSLQLSASGAEVYNWQPPTGLNNPTIADPIASPLQTTTYKLVGTDTKNCFSDSTSVTVRVFPIPQFNIIDSFISLNLGAIDTIRTTNSPDIIRWEWTPPTWINCIDCPQPIVQPKGEITYTARAYNDGGCVATDQVTIKMLCNGVNIFVPNTFSPNNDGINDRFFARGNGQFYIRSFRIFNRFGQMVFEKNNTMANNPADGWDGTFKGQTLSPDVYVYVMEFLCDQNNIFTMKGNVTLLR